MKFTRRSDSTTDQNTEQTTGQNKEQTTEQTFRDSRGRFIAGSVGNPQGRPKKKKETNPFEILLAAQPDIAYRLIDLAFSDNDDVALRATLAILDFTLERQSKLMNAAYEKKNFVNNFEW